MGNLFSFEKKVQSNFLNTPDEERRRDPSTTDTYVITHHFFGVSPHHSYTVVCGLVTE